MLWDMIELQRFNVRQRHRFQKSWNRLQRCACTGVNDYVLAAECTRATVVERHFDGFWRNKPSCAHNKLRATLAVIFEMDVDQILNHLPFAFAHSTHIDSNVLLADAKFLATEEERSHLRAVDDVLAWQAGDVGARTTHVSALDDDYALARLRGGPRDELAADATAENNEIVMFRI